MPVTAPADFNGAGLRGADLRGSRGDLPPPPLPGKLTPLHPDHFNHQGA